MEHIDNSKAEKNANVGRTDQLAAPLNYYRILDVDAGATRMEIRESYLRLKSTYTTGSAALYSLVSEEEAQEQLALAEEAFRILNDDVARHEFDKKSGLGKKRELREPQNHRPIAALGDFVNESQAHWSTPSENAGTVHTARSALPIIKLKASRAGSEDMKRRMQELLDASDPGDGDLFRRLRELCEVTEDEMQERTKICVAYIKAIESNRFEKLPQAVYVKGFLRSYFRYLSVPDAEKLVAAFSARLLDWQANKKG